MHDTDGLDTPHAVALRTDVLALVVTATLGLWLALRPSFDECRGSERELDGIWDAQRQAKFERQVDTLDDPRARESHRRVVASLDRWRETWLGERDQVCRAKRRHVLLVPKHLRLRDECLTRQRRHAIELVSMVTAVDAVRLAKAWVAAADIPDPARCASDLALLGVDPPPRAIADNVEVLRARLARARTLRLIGELEQAQNAIAHVETIAGGLGYEPLIAETLTERAELELDIQVSPLVSPRPQPLADIAHPRPVAPAREHPDSDPSPPREEMSAMDREPQPGAPRLPRKPGRSPRAQVSAKHG